MYPVGTLPDSDHLDLCHAPTDEQFDTDDVAAAIRRGRRDCLCAFVRRSRVPQGTLSKN